MIYVIIHLHNHMHFFRYFDVLPSTVVFHFIDSVDTRDLNSLQKSLF